MRQPMSKQQPSSVDMDVLCYNQPQDLHPAPPDADSVEQTLCWLVGQRERDLELAARIGQQLLEQNKELQHRNDFLEEQLLASNESVEELKAECTRKADLLHRYADSEQEQQQPSTSTAATPTECASVVYSAVRNDTLTQRVQALEKENAGLQQEAAQLKLLTRGLEQKENKILQNCINQLDTATKRIEHLNQELAAKQEECGSKSSEVARLLNEIQTQQKEQRKLLEANEELTLLLHSTREAQDELSREVLDVQDRYSNVVAMLIEAQHELKQSRKRPSFRTHSPDSVYADTLQSELEASDSAYGGSVIQSARSGADTACDLSDLCISSARRYTNVCQQVIHEVNSHDDLAHCAAELGSLVDPNETSADAECPLTKTEELSQPRASTPLVEHASAAQLCPVTPVSAKQQPVSARSSPPKEGSGLLTRVTSTDSLYGYEGPAAGQPGTPGTRDLEYAVRRLQLRRRVERDYEQYRRDRGLSRRASNTPQSLGISERASLYSTPHRGGVGRIVKQLDGSTHLLRWRALALPETVGTLAHTLATPVASQGICVRQQALSAAAGSSSFSNTRPLAGQQMFHGSPLGIEAAVGPKQRAGHGVLTRTIPQPTNTNTSDSNDSELD